MLLLNVLGFMVVIILLITFVLLSLWVFSGFKNKTRFTPTPRSILKEIRQILEIKDNSFVYNLGCNDGRVLFYLAKQSQKAKYIGVESSLFLVSLVRFHNWFNKINHKKTIEILHQDLSNCDFSNATHIFTYLYPNVMDDLLTKLERELKQGTKLVSLNFKFTLKKPIKEIELAKKSYQPIRKIYVYEF